MSAIKDQWCSCTRLREAEEKAAALDKVVRCWECKDCNNEGVMEPAYFCVSDHWNQPGFGTPTYPYGFCAWGKRREP